jgi:hypothetical protein
MTRDFFTHALVIALLFTSAGVSEAGIIFRRKASGRATPVRAAVGGVFRGGCAGGSCGR